ncbi:threonine/homoserine/homoserine lactone efflux protein [Paraburkholderia sp. BL18I3N2]|uniref:LysE family translocator n=1 Tax=Paraburkholderia sp. BL18I3N2 TaxID=1938799 RepID=UPI000D05F80E|nr:LysE family translocator [Paraburkholderia sp. BL18I3N2]PRX34342.1 threonine/homoserine/homoserine lactone efflux protein [Paraburkholderia sp. BL18I3N2]
MTALLSMAAFALASSISPGPVNIVALSAGAQHGLAASMRHVTGATIGFTVLLLLIGLGLHELLAHFPNLITVVKLAGVAFLFYMACKLATDDGQLGANKPARGPSFAYGAAMQWLNPKAWLASLAGMGAYAADGDGRLVWQFSVVYFVICYVSIASWAYAGTFLRKHLQRPQHVRCFNRVMAALLAASALYLLVA